MPHKAREEVGDRAQASLGLEKEDFREKEKGDEGHDS